MSNQVSDGEECSPTDDDHDGHEVEQKLRVSAYAHDDYLVVKRWGACAPRKVR